MSNETGQASAVNGVRIFDEEMRAIRLRQCRVAFHYTRKQLSNMSGICPHSVRYIESGLPCKARTLRRLEKFWGFPEGTLDTGGYDRDLVAIAHPSGLPAPSTETEELRMSLGLSPADAAYVFNVPEEKVREVEARKDKLDRGVTILRTFYQRALRLRKVWEGKGMRAGSQISFDI